MTVDELEQETHDLIDAIATQAPGSRHLHLGRLHGIMAAGGSLMGGADPRRGGVAVGD